MKKEKLDKFIELSKYMPGAITIIGLELHRRGYKSDIHIMRPDDGFRDVNLNSLDRNKYIDDLIDEVKENLCVSEKIGKAYILDFVRTFEIMDIWCNSNYNIENNKIQTRGIIAAYVKIQSSYNKDLKITESRTSDAGEFVIGYAELYRRFKKAFILACLDCGFNYSEIVNNMPIINNVDTLQPTKTTPNPTIEQIIIYNDSEKAKRIIKQAMQNTYGKSACIAIRALVKTKVISCDNLDRTTIYRILSDFIGVKLGTDASINKYWGDYIIDRDIEVICRKIRNYIS